MGMSSAKKKIGGYRSTSRTKTSISTLLRLSRKKIQISTKRVKKSLISNSLKSTTKILGRRKGSTAMIVATRMILISYSKEETLLNPVKAMKKNSGKKVQK